MAPADCVHGRAAEEGHTLGGGVIALPLVEVYDAPVDSNAVGSGPVVLDKDEIKTFWVCPCVSVPFRCLVFLL